MEPYYFHGFRNCNLETLYKVLECGFILPREDINGIKESGTNLYNGEKWISLCQKSLADDYMARIYSTSYNEMIYNNLCVVIDSNLKGIVDTLYIPSDCFYESMRKQLVYDQNKERYSSFIDEVQTDIPISINDFLAIGYPLDRFKKEETEQNIKEIEKRLEQTGLNIPILNSSVYDFGDSKEQFALSKIIKHR